MSDYTIHRLEEGDRSRWDAYVERSSASTFFHLSLWKTVIERSFGFATHFFYAQRGDTIVGVLPLVHVKSMFFGSYLVSTPFCVYGGIVADDANAEARLVGAARELAERLQVGYLELRNLAASKRDTLRKTSYVTFRKSLAEDLDANFKAIPRKQRAMVRKGMDHGLTARVDDDLKSFYELYSWSLRGLGTPVPSKAYFRILQEECRDACQIMTIYRDDRPVSSVLSFYYRDQVLPYYAGANDEARDLKAHDFMYWELMRRACEGGSRIFDFGRSRIGTGSYRFKTHWGFEPEPLAYEYYLVRAGSLPDLSPNNAKYHLAINVWKRMPLWLTQLFGPPLARALG
jgi:FemAB-related protein (PEP-CTERM system-associated)